MTTEPGFTAVVVVVVNNIPCITTPVYGQSHDTAPRSASLVCVLKRVVIKHLVYLAGEGLCPATRNILHHGVPVI